LSDSQPEEIAFLPFHAVNDFMTAEYRLSVIRLVFDRLGELPEERRLPIERLSRRLVQVPGFRNSAKAPTHLKARPAASAFEKNPELALAVLAAWAELHPDLRRRVFAVLEGRGWSLLPEEADRTQMPGFLPRWPASDNFDAIQADYAAAHPDEHPNPDDVSLMAVWLGGRLPYHLDE
jgi:hypothetical protein